MKAGLDGGGCHQYLRKANLCKSHHFICYCNTTQKILGGKILDYGWMFTATLWYGCNSRIDWSLISVSAHFGGVWARYMVKTFTEGSYHWKHIEMTSNRDTDDSCVQKCFTLGLSYLWMLDHTFYCTTAEEVTLHHVDMSKEMHNVGTNTTQSQALT